ncbi:hypothetical protein AB0P19_02410 [Microbacterium oleivorans]|uniref:hypothetical protein n=1 Tax=Microbacterium oleivorans TaxID=273677 RepID=UPI003434C32D
MADTAKQLKNQGDEWFAVCFFYSAYHVIRAAMLDDPIFERPADLAAKHIDLTSQDRFSTRHHGYMSSNGRVLGVNDIVRLLYPEVAVEYRRLHMASIEVRYGEGIGVISPDSVVADYEKVIGEYKALRLIA